jgi:hypothetical protein
MWLQPIVPVKAFHTLSKGVRTAEMPMLMAVSCLSPVIIHTRMPASISVLIASGTPSCSQEMHSH